MNKFGVLENEIFGPILSFNCVCSINNISIGFFYSDNPIDHLIIYNSLYIDDDIDVKDAPTKIARVSILENKILDIYADDSIPKKWIFTDQEKEIIFKTIREHWEIIIRKIKYLQKDNGLQYPKYSLY